MKALSRREATWWNNATPRERVAYFLGTMRGSGYPFPDAPNLERIEHSLGARTRPPTPTIIRVRPPFNPDKPCSYPGCDQPVGEYNGGRYPKYCPPHRDLQRRH